MTTLRLLLSCRHIQRKTNFFPFLNISNHAVNKNIERVEVCMQPSRFYSNSQDPDEIETGPTALRSTEKGALLQPTEGTEGLIEHLTAKYGPLNTLKPAIQPKSGNLATYVQHSKTLQQLVALNVDLSKVEQNNEAANILVRMDFDKEVRPYIEFLHQLEIPDDLIGQCFTKNPDIFLHSVEDLNVPIKYLKSKRFSNESIARIVSKNPQVLSTEVRFMDVQLGYFQKEFKLTGSEVRLAATKLPKLFTHNKFLIQELKFTVLEVMGFTKKEEKQLFLAQPKLFLMNRNAITERFDYLHNTMGKTHEEILEWPDILRTRVHIVKQRHNFLKVIGKDQYDPKKENYVSLKKLVGGNDKYFCEKVAKVPMEDYNMYLKSL